MTNAQAPRGKQAVDLAGVAPLQLIGNRRSAFDGYLSKAITRFGVPGAAVAVILERIKTVGDGTARSTSPRSARHRGTPPATDSNG
jgi:hypothetical protein